MNKFSYVVLFVIILLMTVTPTIAQTEENTKKELTILVDHYIKTRNSKSILLLSKFSELRVYGQKSVTKASYFERNKSALVEEMLKSNIKPKSYAVERFLNCKFHCIDAFRSSCSFPIRFYVPQFNFSPQ